MPASPLSIDEILAAARQRRLWPEVELKEGEPAAEGPSEAAPSPQNESALRAALGALKEEAEQTLGERITATRLQFEQLQALLVGPDPQVDTKAVWAGLDELEDQLEALLR